MGRWPSSSSSSCKPEWVGRGGSPRLPGLPAPSPGSARDGGGRRGAGREAPGGAGRRGGCGPACAAPSTRAARGARGAPRLAMSLLPSLLQLLLLGAPGHAEGAAAALGPEPVLEWQGECARGGRARDGTSGAGDARGVQGEGAGGQAGSQGGRVSAVPRKPSGRTSAAPGRALTPRSRPCTRSFSPASPRLLPGARRGAGPALLRPRGAPG